MQAGSVDATAQLESVTKGRTPVGHAPVVGASSADAPDESESAAHLELASAVGHTSAVSATAETRRDSPRKAAPEAQQPAPHPERAAAANLKLSSEAQRLALIPADVLDAEEIAEVREHVAEAQKVMTAAMDEQRSAARESRSGSDVGEGPTSQPAPTPASESTASQAATQAALSQASSRAENAEVRAQIQSANQSTSSSEPGNGSVSAQETAVPASQATPANTAEPEANDAARPNAMSALQGRSPFESSTPGATGQSLDIVVGSEAPPSRAPA